MGSLTRRLESLEAAFVEGGGSCADELRRRLFRESFRRLGIVEMHVMAEIEEAYRSRPGLSPADVWRELTETQRAMETEWRRTVTAAARDMIHEDPAIAPDLKGGLKREATLAVANAPFWRGQRGIGA